MKKNRRKTTVTAELVTSISLTLRGTRITPAVAQTDVRDRLLVAGIEPAPPMTPEQFGDYLRAEVVKWGKVVKAADITVQTF